MYKRHRFNLGWRLVSVENQRYFRLRAFATWEEGNAESGFNSI